jgi:hypothetical protein
MTEYIYECGPETFSVYASNREDAFDKACEEAADRNLHDERLRLVDVQPYDPSGGDGPED